MWRRTSTEYSGFFQRLGYAIIRTIALVIRGFTSKNLNDTAKSLTYSLIFAVIPILAMVVAVAKGFGVLDIIERQLNHSFLGETNMVPTIMAMVQRYLDTTQGGLFIGIGLVVLLWAVYSFFQSVESAFNRIWNVKRSRYDVYRDSGLDPYAPCLQRRYHDLHSFDRGECDSVGKGI